MKVKDRIKELRRVKACDLLPSPRNWREHPQRQADALRGVLAEVGFADAVLVRETEQGLMLIDGHLRTEVVGDGEIPVLVLDVTAEEADMILATLDPLASLAEANADALAALLADLQPKSEALKDMLDGLAKANGIFDDLPNDANGTAVDESIANDVKSVTCPQCGEVIPL